MIITDDLVYLHIPKTGGTFVEHVMQRVYADKAQLYIDTSTPAGRSALGATHQHQPISEIPDAFRDRDVLITVRNPYDQYVSSFEFKWWQKREGSVFKDEEMPGDYPDYPELSFSEFLSARNDWKLNVRLNSRHAKHLTDKNLGFVSWQLIRFAVPHPFKAVRAMDGPEEECVFSEAMSRITYIPTDNLNRGLYEFLISKGNDPNDVDFVLTLGKVYPPGSRRGEDRSWQSYYDPNLKAMVREKDRLLFKLFPHFDV